MYNQEARSPYHRKNTLRVPGKGGMKGPQRFLFFSHLVGLVGWLEKHAQNEMTPSSCNVISNIFHHPGKWFGISENTCLGRPHLAEEWEGPWTVTV